MTITSVVAPQPSVDALSILTPRVDEFSDGAFASELATTTQALQTTPSSRDESARATMRSIDATSRAQREGAAQDRSAASAAAAKADRADRADRADSADRADRANRAADDRAATAKADRDDAAAEDRAEVAKTKGERTSKSDRSSKSDRAAKTARAASTKDSDTSGDDASAETVAVTVAVKPVMTSDGEQQSAQGHNEGEAIDVAAAKATVAAVASSDQTVAAAVASDLTAAAAEVKAAGVQAAAAEVKATDVKGTDLKATDVKATDVKATDVKGTDLNATATETSESAPVHVKAEGAETASQQSVAAPDVLAQQAFTVAQQGSATANVTAKSAFEGAKPGATSMTVDASTSITATGQSAAPATAMSDTIKATATAAPTPVATQLAAHMSNFRGRADGSYETTLTLHPNDLGQVSIRIEVLNGTIALHAIGAHSAAVDALREAMPQLQQELADAGLNLIGSQVSQQSGQGQQSADRTPVQETAPQINSTLNSSSRSSEQDVSASIGLLGRDGRVDVRV